MPVYNEHRHMDYTPEQLYDLVADIEKYPEFIPWLIRARVRERNANHLVAEMGVGIKMFRDHFISEADMKPHSEIDVSYREGPFQHLKCRWLFTPSPKGGTDVSFHIDFELKSQMLKILLGSFFKNAVSIMVGAFEKRARKIYGVL